jgi:hypothetical protein
MIVFPFSFIRTTANNLLLEYNTFNTSSYSGSGTTIYDISGNSRDGTITGSPTWTSNYFTFSDDYVTTPNLSSAIPISNEVHSVEVWIYPTDNGVLVQYDGTPTPNTSYHFSAIEIVGGNLEVGLWAGISGLISTGNIGAVSFNQWHQIVLTYNGSVCKGYLDGVFKGSVNVSFQSPMDDSQLFYMNFGYRTGTNQGDGTDFNGRFGIMRVYNTALTDAQVLSNYNSTLPTFDLLIKLDANDISSYPGSGTTVFNLQSGSYNHTLTGATYTVLDGIKCFDCTTSTNRVVVNGTGPTLPTTGYTYITWARLKSDNSSFRTLLYTNSPKYTPITVPNGSDTLGYWDSAFRSSGYDLTALEETWVQFSVVGDNSSQSFYINDVQVGSTIAFGAAGTTHWGWGNNDVVPQSWGHVANLYYYNRKLSLSEITEQYNTLSPTFSNYVRSNLVLYFDPNNPSSYLSGSSSVNDLSGNSLNGNVSNVTYTTPQFNFNGSSSQISVADNSLLEPGSGSWTMEVWVNQSASGNDVIFGKFDNGGASQDVSYSIRTTGTTYYAQIGSGSGSGSTLFVNSNNHVGTIGTWYQIVYVFKNGATKTLETFVNGSSIGTVSHNLPSILNSSNPLYFGNYNGAEFPASPQWFDGKIGITRLYNTALTSAQVLQNFNADRNKYGL